MLTLRALASDHLGPIDLAVAAGECVVVRGASGSGKSLFLRAIVDLDLDLDTRDVALEGRSRARMPAERWRRHVALVPAESGWWADRVGEHFVDAEHARTSLAEAGLPDALGWDVARLSTGERRRAALARALEREPRVLLL